MDRLTDPKIRVVTPYNPKPVVTPYNLKIRVVTFTLGFCFVAHFKLVVKFLMDRLTDRKTRVVTPCWTTSRGGGGWCKVHLAEVKTKKKTLI